MKRLALFTLLVASALSAPAQLSILLKQSFDNPSDPWASSGIFNFTNFVSAPTLQTTDVAPIPGNVSSASFAGGAFEFGTNGTTISSGFIGYGLEVWLKNPGAGTGSLPVSVAVFGDPVPNANGNGVSVFIDAAGNYSAGVYNGATFGSFGSVAPGGAGSINGWDHVAVVYQNAQTEFFVNGTSIGTFSDVIPRSPLAGSHGFVNSGGLQSYSGLADDLTFFNFQVGNFNPSLLAYSAALSAVPEPSTYAALAGAAALGLAGYRRRRARTTVQPA